MEFIAPPGRAGASAVIAEAATRTLPGSASMTDDEPIRRRIAPIALLGPTRLSSYRYPRYASDERGALPLRIGERGPRAQRLDGLGIGAPYGTRTRVTAVKGRCPGPLDEGRGRRGAPRSAARYRDVGGRGQPAFAPR